jgi:hypothetical protein
MIREVQSALNKKEADRQRDECQAIATYAAENTDRSLLVCAMWRRACGRCHSAAMWARCACTLRPSHTRLWRVRATCNSAHPAVAALARSTLRSRSIGSTAHA